MDTRLFKERLLKVTGNEKRKEIAEKLNISESTLSKIVNGTKEPTATDLIHIATVYNCSVDYLLGIESHSGNKTYQDFARDITEYYFAFDVSLFNFNPHSHNDDFSITINKYYADQNHIDGMQTLVDFAINMNNLSELLMDSTLSDSEIMEVYETMSKKYVSKVSDYPLPYSQDGWRYDLDFDFPNE